MNTTFKLRDTVNSPSFGSLVVDTAYTFEGYYETMVFRQDQVTGELCCSDGLDVVQYADETEAAAGHQKMLEKWRRR